jgi:5-methyltetrahydrofolate--homocysteine methyltransferase
MKGSFNTIQPAVQEALDNGYAASDIMENGLLCGMEIVGRRFKSGEMFIPEVLRCAKCMNDATALLKPHFKDGKSVLNKGRLLIGTVAGDLHDIGKNIVAMMFEASGYEVIDIGIDQPPERFIESIKLHKPELVGISALLTTTMPKMAETVTAIREAGQAADIKIIVGGAPVTKDFADEIGADAYGPDGASAVEIAKDLLQF